MDREDAFKLSHRGWHAALHAALDAHAEEHGLHHLDAGAFALAAADAAFPDAAAQVVEGDTGEAAPEPAPAASPEAQGKPAKRRETVAELHQRRAIESAAALRAMSTRPYTGNGHRLIEHSLGPVARQLAPETLDTLAGIYEPQARAALNLPPSVAERAAEDNAAIGPSFSSAPANTSSTWQRAFQKARER